MNLNRRIRLQLAFFGVVTLVACGLMGFQVLNLPSLLFGVGQYTVTVNLPATGGLYPSSNVTYRGTEVGRVDGLSLTASGIAAQLSLNSDIAIPADLDAEVHSVTAAGEQYIELIPRTAEGPALKEGDTISVQRTQLPPNINALLSATNSGIEAIPNDNLKTTIDEAYVAFGGLGPELTRIVRGSTTLAVDARANLDALTTLIDESKPLLDSQSATTDSIQGWAADIAQITREVQSQDTGVRGILDEGPMALDETRGLFDRLQPTLPIVLNNLVNVADVAVVYQANIEQLLVLLPRAVEMVQGAMLANRDQKQDYNGMYLSFNLNLNLPPPCNTGYYPAQQRRSPTEVDAPERIDGIVYCRVPQDSSLNVRGARNFPCATRPGKRAPTVAMCESDENYVPLNDGYNWKGDPNATLSGQPVPQPPLDAPPAVAPPPIAVAEYDPITGTYIGPDGRQYTQSNLARGAKADATWEDLLLPPK